MFRTCFALVGISLLLIPGGCGSDTKSTEEAADNSAKAKVSETLTPASSAPSKPSSAPSKPSSAPSEKNGSDPTSVHVKLVEAGQEPRSPLRLTFADKTDTMTMEMATQIQIKVNGRQLPSSPLPRQRLVAKFNIAERISEEEMRVEFVFTEAQTLEDPSVAAVVRNAVDTAIAQMVGTKGSSIVTNRGFNRGGTVELPESATQELRQTMEGFKQSMNSMTVPLPEEPVGVGAKWDVTQKLILNGIRVHQTIHVELLKREGHVITTRNTVKQTAPRQRATPPNLPPGAVMDVLSMTGNSSGEVTLDLGRIVPNSKTSGKSSAKMKVTSGPVTQEMETDTSVEVQISGEQRSK